MSRPLRVLVVGGSLAGLVASLALARRGLDVTVLERARSGPRSGGAVGVDPAYLERVTNVRSPGRGRFSAESWQGLHARLTAAVRASARITISYETQVDAVGEDEHGAWARTPDGVRRGDVLVGADGHRSLVRATVAPERPHAAFAGYVLWIGIAEERDLPPVPRWPSAPDILDVGGAALIGYPLEAIDGGRSSGQRRLGWAWFDPTRTALLRETGAVRDGVVQHSLRPSSLPAATLRDLRDESALWPQPWRAAIAESIERRDVAGIPIAEYRPHRLVSGRMALVGNAAHVPTPMTGKGFEASLDDAAALARVLDRAGVAEVPSALRHYEAIRLDDAAAMVRSGEAFSRRLRLQ